MTLEPGDVILTGTPANSRPCAPGDVVEVELEGVGSVRNEIVEDALPLEPLGAMPKVTPAIRADALGESAPPARPAVSEEALDAAPTGLDRDADDAAPEARDPRCPFLAGLRPTRPDLRMVGYAHTVRYVPVREDVVAADTRELNAQKQAIEEIGRARCS